MRRNTLRYTQNDNVDQGQLQVSVVSDVTHTPIPDANITISYKGDPTSPIEQVRTDISGQTDTLDLPAPPLEYSMEPGENQPYSEYTLEISAPGYETMTIAGTEILPFEKALQEVDLHPVDDPETQSERFVIPDHTLYGNYPPKIPEDEIKPVSETGEIVLSRVVVPEYIVVHDGSPNDTTAKDYYIRYADYIKNVASSEIYATWPASTIRANVLAIMSFTLNRVYTEWYRNKGMNYTITSSTAFDHYWIHQRNIYENIGNIVDELFVNYLSRPNVKQPILTQYCDGRQVSCPNWMTQWGSKYLGDQNYTPVEILRYYYGDNMYINTAEEVSGVPSSWPGYNLDIGANGDKVRQIQEQLNRIARAYPAMPTITVDGQYGPATQNSVREFQRIFNLPVTGIVDFTTWYRISGIYVAVTRIAELV